MHRMIALRWSWLCLLLLCWFRLCKSFSKRAWRDNVKALPGASSPMLSLHFSGFFQISPEKHIHYVYIESERSPSEDSIVFWTNGGPGCSGLLGLFTEMGPWRPARNKTLERNAFSWTTSANMVFLEQPAGVGFSYSTNADTYASFNDFRASRDNAIIIRRFFERFPERKGQVFYIASESYGGHYIPQWALHLLEDPEYADLRPFFKGFLVGNPYTSFASGTIAMANVLWGLQLISRPAWDLVVNSSCDSLSHNIYDLVNNFPECFAYYDALFEDVSTLNYYALDFPVCPVETPLRKQKLLGRSAQTAHHLLHQWKKLKSLLAREVRLPSYQAHFARMKKLIADTPANPFRLKPVRVSETGDEDFNDPPRAQGAPFYDACTEHFTFEYLRDQEVQTALHVTPEQRNGESADWSLCNDVVNENWAPSDYFADTTHLYSTIYNHPNKAADFKMLIFSGDSDGVCATIGTQEWVYDIQNAKIHSLFQPWYYQDYFFGHQPAGFLTKFSNYLSFATVHFAGHEVPAYQPEKALELFRRFLDGTIFYEEPKNPDSSASVDQLSEIDESKGSNTFSITLAVLLTITASLGIYICMKSKS